MKDNLLAEYPVRVLDVIEWSPAGWCAVFLRFEDLVAPFAVDQLYAASNQADIYNPGNTIRVTLQCRARSFGGSGGEKQIRYRYTLDLTPGVDGYLESPVVPASEYELRGSVVAVSGNTLLLDCGRIVEIVLGNNLALPGYAVGDHITVQGALYVTPSA